MPKKRSFSRAWTRRARRVAAGALSVALLGSGLAVSGLPGGATEAEAVMTFPDASFQELPGVAKAPVVLFHEDFENIPHTGPIVPLVDYVSADGYRYSAEGPWADPFSKCNGFVTSGQNQMGASCAGNPSSQGGLLALVNVLGQVNGTDPETNAAAAAYTAGPRYAENLIEFETVGESIPLPTANRFITFSVNAAATSCGATFQPEMRFSVLSGGEEIEISDAPINPCTDKRATQFAPTDDPDLFVFSAGTFASDGSFLTSGSSVGIRMRNVNGGTSGNDGAFDDIRLLDVTPHLNKEFLPERVPSGSTSTLTLTVTNTSELASKDGWAFTDTLRSGLTVAADPRLGGTCAADVAAAPGSSAIAVTSGVLAAGEESCTITVDVTSAGPRGAAASPATFVNNASDLTGVIGLDVTNETTVEFYSEPKLAITKSVTGPEAPQVGDTISFTVIAQNVGNGDFGANQLAEALQNAVVMDDLSAVLDDAQLVESTLRAEVGGVQVSAPTLTGTTLNWAGPLAAGAAAATTAGPWAGETVTITFDMVLLAGGDGSVLNTACVPAAVSNGEACASAGVQLPALEVRKIANVTEVSTRGGVVEYTVTITNPGPGDWSEDRPAELVDDLSEVLDDASLVTGSLRATVDGSNAADPSFSADAGTLTWTGALAAGSTATVTYAVEFKGDGDNTLSNVACVPSDATRVGVEPCATATVLGGLLWVEKTAAVSSTPLGAGSTVEYTLTFESVGLVPTAVDYTDFLTDVLDDADIIVEPHAATGDLEVLRDGEQIRVTGVVPAGETMTVAYEVEVLADGDRGNDLLVNHLLPVEGETPGPAPENCTAAAWSDGVVAGTCTRVIPEPIVPPVTPTPPGTPPAPDSAPLPLATTGVGSEMTLWMGAALVVAGVGALLLMLRRRNAR